MSKWNIGNIRKIAGLPLNEAWDRDDDDEDPDAKIAMSDKGQQAFEKKNKGELESNAAMLKKRTADQKAAAEKKKAEAKPAEKKEEPKKEAPKAEEKKPVEAKKEEPKAEEPKKEEPKAEAKRRGAAPNENSFNQQAKKYAKEHTRGSFIKWAKDTHGKGTAYASALFAKYNPKSGRTPAAANECYVITHPHMPSFLLAENREMNQMQWIDPTSPMEPMMFSTLAEAEKTAKYMSEWKSQASKIEHIVFED
jgi:outer membrane biosynthesis protein TonB